MSRWHGATRSRSVGASPGVANAAPRDSATSAREASVSTTVTVDAGDAGEQAGHAEPDHAGTDDGDPVADQRAGVPERVDRGLDRPCQHRPSRGHVVGNHGDGLDRHDVRRLVGVEAEDGAVAQVVRTRLDHADVEVAVLHRAREVTLLERRAHRGVLALGDAAPEDERLGSAADAGHEGADQHLAGTRIRQDPGMDLAGPGLCQPVRAGRSCHVGSLHVRRWFLNRRRPALV